MPKEQKLTKEILLNALGKTENTPEVQKIFQILGQADRFEDVSIEHQIYDGREYTYVDAEMGLFGYSWHKYGIQMNLMNEDTYADINYPLTKIPEVCSFLLLIKPDIELGYKSCLTICNDPFFYEGMTIEEIEKQYGEPQRRWTWKTKQIGRNTYYNLEGFEKTSLQFSFDLNSREIFDIALGLEEK